MTEKSKRINWCEFLTMSAQVAVLLAVSVLASDYLARPAYARANAASKATHAIPTTPKPEDMLKSRAWAKRFFSSAADLPISFVLDEKAIHGIPQEWHPVLNRRRIDANISETVFEGTDARTGLNVRVECTEYHDYPVMEWVAWFTNKGQEPTPIIRDILALDGTFTGSSPVLYHCNGDFYSAEGYTPQETPLPAGDASVLPPTAAVPVTAHFPTTASCSRTGACPSPSAGPHSGRPVSMGLRTVCMFGRVRKRQICG